MPIVTLGSWADSINTSETQQNDQNYSYDCYMFNFIQGGVFLPPKGEGGSNRPPCDVLHFRWKQMIPETFNFSWVVSSNFCVQIRLQKPFIFKTLKLSMNQRWPSQNPKDAYFTFNPILPTSVL